MLRRRRRISCAGVAILAAGLALGGMAGAQAHAPLAASLSDLAGWTAEPAEGMSMDAGGMKMVNAHRVYRQGDKRLEAQLTVGPAGMAGIADVKIEVDTADSRMKTRTVDGFEVMTTFTKPDRRGGVSVVLDRSEKADCLFLIEFEGMSDDDALKIARQFDWKAMKKAALAAAG